MCIHNEMSYVYLFIFILCLFLVSGCIIAFMQGDLVW